MMTARRGLQEPRSTWLGRLLRGLLPDRNPLRRGSDRAEVAVLCGLLAAFLVGAPFAAHAVGSWTNSRSLRIQHAQSAAWHQVRATLLQAAPDWNGYGSGPGAAPETMARWKAPDGQVRTGAVYVPSGAAVGGTVMVWTDRAGQLTGPPLQSSQIAARADLNEALAVWALAVTLIVIGWLAHWMLDRRRLAAWDADWLATAPRWSPRR
jgi:hypothetical protein